MLWACAWGKACVCPSPASRPTDTWSWSKTPRAARTAPFLFRSLCCAGCVTIDPALRSGQRGQRHMGSNRKGPEPTRASTRASTPRQPEAPPTPTGTTPWARHGQPVPEQLGTRLVRRHRSRSDHALGNHREILKTRSNGTTSTIELRSRCPSRGYPTAGAHLRGPERSEGLARCSGQVRQHSRADVCYAACTSTRSFSPASRTWSCRASRTNCA